LPLEVPGSRAHRPQIEPAGGISPAGLDDRAGGAPYPDGTMAHLSDKARASQQALRDASTQYQAVVDQVIEDPRGPFVERLRDAGERVAEAAARWALDYIDGAEPGSDGAG
jgi:hypothetical protein